MNSHIARPERDEDLVRTDHDSLGTVHGQLEVGVLGLEEEAGAGLGDAVEADAIGRRALVEVDKAVRSKHKNTSC